MRICKGKFPFLKQGDENKSDGIKGIKGIKADITPSFLPFFNDPLMQLQESFA